MTTYFHSVTLDAEKCKGCTNCIKRCPTEAIRVRGGKAAIIEERCVDCGECIRICPNHAKIAVTDTLERIHAFKKRIALPAPALFGQFDEDVPPDAIIQALRDIGFDEVYEVAAGAEAVTVGSREFMKQNRLRKPWISSACPAAVRLMQVRFPSLLEYIMPVESPMEISARLARKAFSRAGLKVGEGDVGTFFISPCPAKVTAVKQPVGEDVSAVDGTIAISLIYPEILKRVSKMKGVSGLRRASRVGYSWGRSGGEALAIAPGKMLAVDGIHSCITVLEEIERGRLADVEYIELQACVGGCIGGCLTVLNPFVARVRLRSLVERLGGEPMAVDENWAAGAAAEGFFSLRSEIRPRSVMALDSDVTKAISKMQALEETLKGLPGLDCGSCGSPSCRALAEDIVRGTAAETDCTFKLRERVQVLAEQVVDLARRLPPPMAAGQHTPGATQGAAQADAGGAGGGSDPGNAGGNAGDPGKVKGAK
ncbi:MAG: 4Fe-4S binding protein [Firmicutes bacterium]|nr:4Fe-4S binding protein [Bacillota bacterium]